MIVWTKTIINMIVLLVSKRFWGWSSGKPTVTSQKKSLNIFLCFLFFQPCICNPSCKARLGSQWRPWTWLTRIPSVVLVDKHLQQQWWQPLQLHAMFLELPSAKALLVQRHSLQRWGSGRSASTFVAAHLPINPCKSPMQLIDWKVQRWLWKLSHPVVHLAHAIVVGPGPNHRLELQKYKHFAIASYRQLEFVAAAELLGRTVLATTFPCLQLKQLCM